MYSRTPTRQPAGPSHGLKKHALTVTRESLAPGSDRLDQVLANWLPQVLGEPVSRGKVRKLIVAGAVYLNRKRVRIASKQLQPGARLEVFIDSAKLAQGGPSQDRVFKMSESHVLFEDEYLLVVNKPPGLPTQPTLDEARDNLFAAVKRFLADRATKASPGGPPPYVGLHHRLDRDTSGVVLFTKRTEANAGVAELFGKHLALKVYHAITVPGGAANTARENWTVENYLGKDQASGGKRSRFTAVRSGGDYAKTGFRVLERLPRALSIEASPLTGRTHQIRVHLAGEGLPILGDALYGGVSGGADALQAPRMMLHAARLTFPHPIHNNEVTVTSPIPEDFTACLHRLRARASL